MNTLDIILLLLFIPSIVRGLSKGLISQALSFASIFVSAYLAFHFSSAVEDWLGCYVRMDSNLLYIISFVSIVVIAVLLMNIVARILTKVINLVSLGWLDKLLGLAFSVAGAVLVTGLLLTAVRNLNGNLRWIDPEVFSSSKVCTFITSVCDTVFPFIKNLVETV